VPKARWDDCRLQAQALQAENARLKDQALALRNQNRDLSQRALDDSHRLHALEDANSRLERSLSSYQRDHEQMVEAFEQLEREIQLATGQDGPQPR
jgi:chromosome segregation ATPase